MYTVGIITSSDKGYAGEREDKSGAVIKKIVEENGFKVERQIILPDEKEMLKKEFINKLVYMLRNSILLNVEAPQWWDEDSAPEATEAEKLNWSARLMAFIGLE